MSLLALRYIDIPLVFISGFSLVDSYVLDATSYCLRILTWFPQGHCWLASVQLNFLTYFSNLRYFNFVTSKAGAALFS